MGVALTTGVWHDKAPPPEPGNSSQDDEYKWAGLEPPKVMVTTSRDPSARLRLFAKVGGARNGCGWGGCGSGVGVARFGCGQFWVWPELSGVRVGVV